MADMSIGLHRLRYFHAAALEGSISAAARKLNVAQPALSYQIAAIERELGAALLHRSNRGTSLTPAGALLYRRTTHLMSELSRVEDEIRATVATPHGEVRVALAVTMARMLVPPLLRLVDEHYPRIELKIADVQSVTAIEAMRSGQADLALAPNGAEMANCLVEPLYRERLCFISRRREGDGEGPITMAEVADHPLVLTPRRYDLRRRVEEAAIEAGRRLDVRYEQDSQETIRAIVLAGIAATVSQATSYQMRTERPQLLLRPIVAPQIVRTHAIVRRHDAEEQPALGAVACALRQVTRGLVASGAFPGVMVPPPAA